MRSGNWMRFASSLRSCMCRTSFRSKRIRKPATVTARTMVSAIVTPPSPRAARRVWEDGRGRV